jgi:RNA-splicing ligase RtcB
MKDFLAMPQAASIFNMRRTMIGAAVIMAGAVLTASYAVAQQSCQDLWVERNSYYKEAGYCFKTARAISYFGNAGCRYEQRSQGALVRARARAHRRDHPARAALRLQLTAGVEQFTSAAPARAATGH